MFELLGNKHLNIDAYIVLFPKERGGGEEGEWGDTATQLCYKKQQIFNLPTAEGIGSI